MGSICLMSDVRNLRSNNVSEPFVFFFFFLFCLDILLPICVYMFPFLGKEKTFNGPTSTLFYSEYLGAIKDAHDVRVIRDVHYLKILDPTCLMYKVCSTLNVELNFRSF